MIGFGYMPAEATEVDDSIPWHQRLAFARYSIEPHATIPQHLADVWTDIMVEACRGFHEEDYVMQPALDYIDDLEDGMVARRIAGYQKGYNLEYDRRAVHGAWSDLAPSIEGGYEKLRYIFADLPTNLQRAIVSHWDRLHYEWLAEHPTIHYEPKFGYFWLIGGSVIKFHEGVDGDTQPTERETLDWERVGAAGGMYGWAASSATAVGTVMDDYTGYPTEFED